MSPLPLTVSVLLKLWFPIPYCPLLHGGLHWHGHPLTPLLFPLQLHQQTVATAAGDPLAEQRSGHWPWGKECSARRGYPAGVPCHWQPSLAIDPAKAKALAFTHQLPGPHLCPALRAGGLVQEVLKAQDIRSGGAAMEGTPQHHTRGVLVQLPPPAKKFNLTLTMRKQSDSLC